MKLRGEFAGLLRRCVEFLFEDARNNRDYINFPVRMLRVILESDGFIAITNPVMKL
jgi:hypothetical protein